MPHPVSPISPDRGMPPALLDTLLRDHRHATLPSLRRMWRYYRNRRQDQAGSNGALAQEEGLPARLRRALDGQPKREIVIENDIAWRIHTQVDFMFGRPVALQSLADDPELAQRINDLLAAVFRGGGGVTFFQDLALLGSVYGSVDILVRCDPDANDPAGGFSLELIEATRAVPLMNAGDYRQLDGYVAVSRQLSHDTAPPTWPKRLRGKSQKQRIIVEQLECWTPDTVEMMRGPDDTSRPRRAHHVTTNPLGCVPVVHIQNLPQPFSYAGLSDVEPLIPLQDELNTRLSDRANRVTLACFKMYLAKGLEGFTERPIGPGQMWATDNPDASIEAFGGDSETPSEDTHIEQVREALDKTSGVSPIAAGVLRGRVGNLTSENAVRIVLLGLMARTEKETHHLRRRHRTLLRADPSRRRCSRDSSQPAPGPARPNRLARPIPPKPGAATRHRRAQDPIGHPPSTNPDRAWLRRLRLERVRARSPR